MRAVLAKTRYVRYVVGTAYRPEGDSFYNPGPARLRQPGTMSVRCGLQAEGETRLTGSLFLRVGPRIGLNPRGRRLGDCVEPFIENEGDIER